MEISDLLSAGSGVGDASSCVARAVIGGWLIVSLLTVLAASPELGDSCLDA
jgi:hypothetical protein